METLNKLLAIDANLIIIGMLLFFYTLEQLLSTPFRFSRRPQHLIENATLWVPLLIINYFFIRFQVFSIEWLNGYNPGINNLTVIPYWARLIISVALYDLVTYWIHRATHKVPLLWRFHRVHHSDTTLDASTFLRFHPLELTLVFGTGNILTAGLFGTDLFSMVLYYFVLNIFVFFEHSNLHYSTWLDKTLGWIFVTPNQHKVHHEQDQQYTDSNFADIFILWDRLFGTYRYKPVKSINFGLKEFEEEEKQGPWYQIRLPFLNVKRISSDELARIREHEV